MMPLSATWLHLHVGSGSIAAFRCDFLIAHALADPRRSSSASPPSERAPLRQCMVTPARGRRRAGAPLVRNLVGTLHAVGRGVQDEGWPRRVLDGRDRTRAGQTAPPEGLCFMRVDYAEPIAWMP